MPPMAHELKIKFTDRWVRFHSLPESKRYPESNEEYQEILSRHNQVLNELCVMNNEVYLIAPEYSDNSEPHGLGPELGSILQSAEYWQSLPMHKLEDDEEFHYFWHLHYVSTKWESGSLDPILRKVANDEIGNFMVVNVNLGWVYHPYDGGADVVLKNINEMQVLKQKYKGWLSAHASGL